LVNFLLGLDSFSDDQTKYQILMKKFVKFLKRILNKIKV